MEVPIDKNFENKIRGMIKTFQEEEDTELEFRFGKFVRGFHAGISPEIFKDFLNELKFHPDFILESSSFTTEIYTNKFRKIIYKSPQKGDQYIKKYRLNNLDIDFSEYVCRLSLSREYSVKPEDLSLEVLEEKFNKIRWSFTHKSRQYRLDFSLVDNKYYDIELEFLNRNITYENLIERLSEVYSFISSTNYVLPYLERINVITSFNILQGKYDKKFPFIKFNKPINLPRNKLSELQGNYVISPKIDGVRFFMYVHQGNAYLLNHKLVLKFAKDVNPIFNESIFDVEKLNEELYILDLLYFKGYNYTNLSYIDRLQLAKDFKLNNVYVIDTNKNLLDGYFQFLNYQNTDGVMFTPIKLGYYNNETYKYKPVQTIDFYVKKLNDNVFGLYSLGENKKFVFFTGVEPYSFPGKQLLYDDEIELIQGGDKIVEFYWKGDRFVPMRIREDKETPNYIEVAKNIWYDINNPIQENELFNNFRKSLDISKNITLNKMDYDIELITSFFYVFRIDNNNPEVSKIIRDWVKKSWPSYYISFVSPLDSSIPNYYEVKVKLMPRKLGFTVDIKDKNNKDAEILDVLVNKLYETMTDEELFISAVTIYRTEEQKNKLIKKIKTDIEEPKFIQVEPSQSVLQPVQPVIPQPIQLQPVQPVIPQQILFEPPPPILSESLIRLSSVPLPQEEKALVLFKEEETPVHIPKYKELSYLTEGKYELLPTPLDSKDYKLLRFYAVPDGSCFFHSVSSAIDDDYKALKTSSQKSKYMVGLRKGLRDFVNNPQVFSSIDNGNIYLFYVWNNFIKTIQKYQKIYPASDSVRLFKTEVFDTPTFNSLKNINFDEKDPVISNLLQKLSDTRDSLDQTGKFNIDKYHKKVVDVMSDLVKSKFKGVNENELRKLLNTIYSKVEEAAIKTYSEQLGDLGCFFNNQFLPILADFFNVDLYIIRAKDGYRMPVRGFCDILKGRTSVVLLQIEDSHYELVGSVNPKTKKADIAFTPDHPLIQKLKHIVCSEIQFLNNNEFKVFYEFYKMK